jgi:ppGpp synthetase/RelA/SpoT-type nucleotidyltranferase
MTQAELAEKLGLSASAIGMYEQGRREPDLAVIMQLCDIFDVPADILLATSPKKQSFEIKDVIQDIQERLLTAQDLTLDGVPVSLDGMRDLTDIAGIRVICNYVDDLYTMADLLLRQDDIELIARKDYIANPKESGYRSLHLVVLVPVFQAARTERMPVEIQLRTIAQDTWASLEHELKYKKQGDISEEDRAELITCAKILADVDERMQKIHHRSILGPIAQG